MLLNNHSSITGRSGYLPIQFQFNSSMDLYDKVGNLTQRKYFVSNANVIKDIDYSMVVFQDYILFHMKHYWEWELIDGVWAPKRG